MIQLKGNRGAYLINPASIELIEIEPETTTIVTAHARVTVPTEENLEAIQCLSAGPITLAEAPQVYPF